jgi:beta-lactamase superfamily II metal-dependent hydrolase
MRGSNRSWSFAHSCHRLTIKCRRTFLLGWHVVPWVQTYVAGKRSCRKAGQLKCEIEFLAVGEGTKAGDAIVIRYGEVDAYNLMLVDGGHAGTGDDIVAHLKKHFGPRPVLEHVLLTHSDVDHASGLRTVLQTVKLNNLWLHVPWLLAEEARHLFADKRWTAEALKKKIKDEYDIISEIFDLACAAGVKMFYPFAGSSIGPFQILSPTRYVYRYLLPQFDKTPEPDQAAIQAANMWLGKENLAKKLFELAKAAVQSWTKETWNQERLKDGGCTSASNESSVVLYGAFEKGPVLLTGDTGINGLTWAADNALAKGLSLQQFSFVQIPHHGSRRNVGPSILTRLLGEKQQESDPTRFTAFVSAPADDATHPRRIVLNAFKRRGGDVIATQGFNKLHYGGFPAREGYSTAEPLPFYADVEEYT